MLKFLRKYNMYILVVFGSLLMVAFTAPQAIQQMGLNPLKKKAATVVNDGKIVKVTVGDLELASREASALRTFAPGLTAFNFRLDRESEHWFLLTLEAKQGGFVAEQGDGAAWIPQLARMNVEADWVQKYGQYAVNFMRFQQDKFEQEVAQMAAIMEQRLPYFAGQGRFTADEFKRVLTKARGVYRMQMAYQNSGRISDVRTILAARKQFDGATVDFLAVPATRLVSQIADPDEQTLKEHYERFVDTPRGGGDYGIGYLLPGRIKIEWLMLDRKAIEAAISIDPIELDKQLKQQADKYPDASDEDKAAVKQQMIKVVADEVIVIADRSIRTEIMKSTRKLVKNTQGYFELTDEWTGSAPKMEQLAQIVVDQVVAGTRDNPSVEHAEQGVVIPLPTVNIKAQKWIYPEQIAELQGIGQSQMLLGALRVPFTQVVFQAKEYGGSNKIQVQAHVPFASQIITDTAGNRYYFTLLDAVDQSPPASMDEILDDVLVDYKKLQAYELLHEQSQAYTQVAAGGGLDVLAESLNTRAPEESEQESVEPKNLVVAKGVRVTRAQVATPDPTVNVPAFRDGVIDRASSLNPLITIDQISLDDRTLRVEIPEQLMVTIVQIQSLEPLTIEDFRQSARAVALNASLEEFRQALATEGISNPFSMERLIQRHQFKAVSSKKKDDAPSITGVEDDKDAEKTDESTG